MVMAADPTYKNTGDSPVLDLYYKTVRGVNVVPYLTKAWSESPLDTVRVMFHVRDCRGGKGEKKLFHDFMRWLLVKNPSVFKHALQYVPEYGSYKDLIKIGGDDNPMVEELFGAQLLADIHSLARGESVSLAAKWIPSEGSVNCGLTKAVAALLDVNMATLRKTYLSPLRAQLKLVESKMCAGEWDAIDFSTVPSVALQQYTECFKKRCTDRWKDYLAEVARGTSKINVSVLHPHQVLAPSIKFGSSSITVTHLPEVELKWKAMVATARDETKLGRCIALVDVSGSMYTADVKIKPIQIALSLGMLISELSTPPFQHSFITFSTNPQLVRMDGADTVAGRLKNMASSTWGGSTDLRLAFDVILRKLQENPGTPAPETLIILSDMNFNSACSTTDTTLEAINRKYAAAGFRRPDIVFWNLADSIGAPATRDMRGITLVSGFSTCILKTLMTGTTPYEAMRQVIDGERYAPLSSLFGSR